MISTPDLAVDEGGSGSFTVALSRQPFLPLQLRVERVAGAAEISLKGGMMLYFTPENWSTPQAVTVAAGPHPSGDDRTATFTVGGSGLAPGKVVVTGRNTAGSGRADAGASPDGGGDAPAPLDAAGERGAAGDPDPDDGCGCRLGQRPRGGAAWLWIVLAAGAWLGTRRTAARTARRTSTA